MGRHEPRRQGRDRLGRHRPHRRRSTGRDSPTQGPVRRPRRPGRRAPGGRAVVIEEVCEVVITAPDPEWLATYTRKLVDDRLAAGGHVITDIRAIYRWQGEIHDKPEARVVLYTRRRLLPAIIERTNREHPYDVPHVTAMPLDGSPAYVQWVLDETSTP